MARIKDKSVRDVIDAANIVDVVGQRTSLRKSSGTRYMGRCPFHEERSPSFSAMSWTSAQAETEMRRSRGIRAT